MEEPNKSPLPTKPAVGQAESLSTDKVEPKEFDFYVAMEEISNGNKVSKREWNNRNIYGYLLDEKLTLKKEETNFHWIISLTDLVGDDYFII